MNESELNKLKTQAEQGDAEAQFQLGRYYDNIDGTAAERDIVKAVEWYRRAAVQGHAKAQNNLASCYYHGEGVPENLVEALKWFAIAAKGGSEKAKKTIALLKETTKIIDAIENAINNGYSVEALNDGQESNSDSEFDDRIMMGVRVTTEEWKRAVNKGSNDENEKDQEAEKDRKSGKKGPFVPPLMGLFSPPLMGFFANSNVCDKEKESKKEPPKKKTSEK